MSELSCNSISKTGKDIQHLVLDDTNSTTTSTNTKTTTEGGYSGSQTLQTVQILQSSKIKCIGAFAFYGCTSLESVHIDEEITLEAIENNAFYNCSALESVGVPNSGSFSHIGSQAFASCTSLKSIDIPPSCQRIGKNCFEMCSSLQSICVPESVEKLERGVFICCKSLVSVHFGRGEGKGHSHGLTKIGHGAFRGCTKLQSVDIPKSVTSIGHGAFHNCTSLVSIHIPNGVTTIGINTFYYCESIRSIHIPNTVTVIERFAFRGCVSLQSVYIPDSVTTVQRDAFAGCILLEQRRTNGLNYHSDTVTWLRQRFHNLPIHQACYHYRKSTSVTPNNLSALVKNNKHSLTDMDAMGMMPIHILCCNPEATIEMVQLVVGENNLSLVLSQTDVSQNTPLKLFLQCRNLILLGEEEEEQQQGQQSIPIPSLQDLLEIGVKGEDLDILFILSDNQEIDFSNPDESTGLLPFMSAATFSRCGLDAVFKLAIHNLDAIL